MFSTYGEIVQCAGYFIKKDFRFFFGIGKLLLVDEVKDIYFDSLIQLLLYKIIMHLQTWVQLILYLNKKKKTWILENIWAIRKIKVTKLLPFIRKI